jgi:hypothetical protein
MPRGWQRGYFTRPAADCPDLPGVFAAPQKNNSRQRGLVRPCCRLRFDLAVAADWVAAAAWPTDANATGLDD